MKKDEKSNAGKKGKRLSAHLLRESDRFWIYPYTHRRTKGNLANLKLIDDEVRKLMEGRQAFAPPPSDESESADESWKLFKRILDTPLLFDQVYCRLLLGRVPKIVERHRNLSHLTLSEIVDRKSFVYLTEAANCYILGLPQAAIALSRAAVEAHLRNALEKVYGVSAVRGAGLKVLVNDYARRGQFLSLEGRQRANAIREAGDGVLHEEPADSESALEVIEAARAVILELEEKKGGS